MRKLFALLFSVVILLLCIQCVSADIRLLVKSSLIPQETLKIYLKLKSEFDSDVYVVVVKDNAVYSILPENRLVPGIVSYGTYKVFNGVVLDVKLSVIPPEASGKYLVIAASVPKGIDPLTYEYSPSNICVRSLTLRSSSPRNTSFLNLYLQKVEQNRKAYIYGIYGARLLMVYHPELYLQADDLFLRVLFRVEGSSWFLDRDPASIGPEEYLERPGEPSFSMSMINLSDYDSVEDFEVYPQYIPYLNWFDRRVAPISFILKAKREFGLKLTHLEKAFLLYFYKKYAEHKPLSGLFIVYSLDGSAYLYDAGQIIDLQSRAVSTDEVSKPVVLVFNEKSVWYPLMGRDDSRIDRNLAKALSLLSVTKDDVTLIFSEFEQEALNVLRKKTKFSSQDQIRFAKYVAMNAGAPIQKYGYKFGLFQRNSPIPSSALLNWDFYIRILSSSLSPFSDYLAYGLEHAGYTEFSRRFLEFNQWGGETVSIDTGAYTIDIGFRANVGTCRDLSVYAAAGLETAGKYWVRIHGIIPSANSSGSMLTANYPHFYVYVPEDEAFVDNGRYGNGGVYGFRYVWGGVPEATIPTLDNFCIDIVTTPEGFVIFQIVGSPPYYAESKWNILGSFPKETSLELLRGIYRDSYPKPFMPVYDAERWHAVSSLPFEDGLEIVSKYYRQLQVPP